LVKPYTDIIQDDGTIVREFIDVDESTLVWHRDKANRIVKVLEGSGWFFQYDDQLPFELNIGDIVFIPEMEYHRLIKGENQLIIQINEIKYYANPSRF